MLTKEQKREWYKNKCISDPEWAEKHRSKARARSLQWYKDNREQHKRNTYSWRERNPEKTRESARKSMAKRYPGSRKFELVRQRYGLTIERYRELVNECNGTCTVCKRPFGNKGPYVDHCHKSGVVRGILCQKCNFFEGMMETSENVLRLYEYMKRHESLCEK